ncbi:MAG: MarC family protein, partial [Thaumarchaeota archaeon]|nr:MarC family protein [Nitrososphaerota archaeon]
MILTVELFGSIIALFVIVDPLGNVPIFLGLTQ